MCEVYEVYDWGRGVRWQTVKCIVHNGKTVREINTVIDYTLLTSSWSNLLE